MVMERSQKIHWARNGLVYSQEPAAQIVAQVAQPKPMSGLRLSWQLLECKTTQLILFGQSGDSLVSNEIHKGRLKILVENVERFGARSVLVDQWVCQADRLGQNFLRLFWLDCTRRPVSVGEGMFRRNQMPWTIGPSIILESAVSFKERF